MTTNNGLSGYQNFSQAFSDMKNFTSEQTIKLKELLSFYDNIKKISEKEQAQPLRILNMCPPSSVLENFVNVYFNNTNIPLANVYFTVMTVLATIITKTDKKIYLSEGGKTFTTAQIWIMLLGNSGSGKSFCIDEIEKIFFNEKELNSLKDNFFNEAKYRSRASIVEDFQNNPEWKKGLLIEDEFAQTLKNMKKQEDIRDMFLTIHGGKISATTKKDGRQEVRDIQTSVLAMTALASIDQNITLEDVSDGLFQRFVTIIVEQKDRGAIGNWPYDIKEEDYSTLKKSLVGFVKNVKSIENFVMSQEAMSIWKLWYVKNFNSENESFYNRYMWSASKFASIFCAMAEGREKPGLILKEDMAWALRLVNHGLDNIYKVTKDYLGLDKFDQLCNRVKRYIEENTEYTVRQYLQNLKISKAQLISICEILQDRGNTQAAVVLQSIFQKK